MTEKIKAYLEGMFATLPMTDEVMAAKEELSAGMVERYYDYLDDGFDEQEAYDSVIDSIGDIRELFDELNKDSEKESSKTNYYHGSANENNSSSQNTFNFSSLFDSITEFTTSVVSGIFSNVPEELKLVNTQTLSLEEISKIDVSYISESMELIHSTSDELIINEYMNREDPSLHAEITMNNGQITIRNGRRQNILWLRSRIEILVPASWIGSLALSTVAGSITSKAIWKFTSFRAKSISGQINLADMEANMIRLSSTSGAVLLERGSGSMEMHSISGSIKVDTAIGGGVFKTTAGSVRVNFEKLTGHVDSSTVSGGIRLGLPEEASFELDAKTIAGSISTAFDEKLHFQKRNKADGFVGTAPYLYVRVHSTSGGIHIND